MLIWLRNGLYLVNTLPSNHLFQSKQQNNFALDLTYLILLNGQPPLNLS